MSEHGPETIGARLREAFANGDPAPLADCYSEDALLDVSLRGRRARPRGRAAILAELGSWWSGPAPLVEWAPRFHPEGVDLWVERVGEDGAGDRQRQYLRIEDGLITRHWAYAAPPRTPPPGVEPQDNVHLDPGLLAPLGVVVEHEPIVSIGWSGNVLERVRLADGTRLVAKRIVPGQNWIDRRTRDRGREALLFRDGVLGRLPPAIDHTVVAADRDGDAWWVVMRDVSDRLLPDGKRLSREEARVIVEAANGMWEEFWGEEVPHVSTLEDALRLFGPQIAEEERDALDLLPKQYGAFWEAFTTAVDDDVAGAVMAIHEDPRPLVAELDALGTTLVHCDIRDEQIGFDGERLILLDWGRATQGHPVVDFFWSLCHNAWRIDATRDELVEDFRRARGDADDPRAVELGYITGLVMYGWIFGHSAAYHPDPAEREWARAELAWWVPRARRALETWSPT